MNGIYNFEHAWLVMAVELISGCMFYIVLFIYEA